MRTINACGFGLVVSVLWLLPICTTAQTSADNLIFPDPGHKIVVVEATGAEGRKVTGRILPETDSLAMLALADLNQPFNASMIRMSQCARNLAGNHIGPNIIFLSKNEGGFPRTGVSLIDEDGKETNYPQLQYVDLVLDKSRIAQGDLSIYTHELGHVMMGLILGGPLDKLDVQVSPKQHVSMGITDYLTAFYEGWGIHFQRLAYDQTEKYRATADAKLTPDKAMSLVWHSGLDEYLRLNFVRENGYIFEKLVQQGPETFGLETEQRILLDHTSPVFDHTRIKNAQQMLSCEGVIATLFYQINTNSRLIGNYQNPEFYTPFLLKPIPDGQTPDQLFTPLENMMFKHFWVWYQLSQQKISGSPMIAWLNEWCRQYPGDREEILRLFIQITQGATITSDLARLSEKINYLGQIGEYYEYKKQLPVYQAKVKELVQLCMEEPHNLSANIGPELWVHSKSVNIRRALWMPEPKNPLAVNLNTASLPEAEVFIGKEKAGEFLKKRRELGYFSSMKQIRDLGF